MNKKVRFVLIIIGIILLIIVANIAMKNLSISKVEVEMIYKGSDKLIVKEQVYSLLNKKYGAFTNYKIKEIDTKEIEEFLKSKNKKFFRNHSCAASYNNSSRNSDISWEYNENGKTKRGYNICPVCGNKKYYTSEMCQKCRNKEKKQIQNFTLGDERYVCFRLCLGKGDQLPGRATHRGDCFRLV
jgi:hypothetical protein